MPQETFDTYLTLGGLGREGAAVGGLISGLRHAGTSHQGGATKEVHAGQAWDEAGQVRAGQVR